MEVPNEVPKERQKITEGYYVGDTVILLEETELTKSQGLKPGVVGVVSVKDDANSLIGWKVVDYEKNIKEKLDNMKPEEVGELFEKLVNLGKIEDPENETGESKDNVEKDDGSV